MSTTEKSKKRDISKKNKQGKIEVMLKLQFKTKIHII